MSLPGLHPLDVGPGDGGREAARIQALERRLATLEREAPPSATPVFAARRSSAQSISNATWTEVVFNDELVDSNAWYNPATGRFTPQASGYYVFVFNGWFQVPGLYSYAVLLFNGSTKQRIVHHVNPAGGDAITAGMSVPMLLNGSTDYASIGAQSTSGGAGLYGDSGAEHYTTFSGWKVR